MEKGMGVNERWNIYCGGCDCWSRKMENGTYGASGAVWRRLIFFSRGVNCLMIVVL